MKAEIACLCGFNAVAAEHYEQEPTHPRQTNSATSLAEPAFYDGALAQQLTSQFGEKFTLATGPILPLDNYPGDATAVAILGHGRSEAIAEPVRLGGGSALAVHPSP